MDEHLKSQPKRIGIGRLFKSVGLVLLCGCFFMMSGAADYQSGYAADAVSIGAADGRAVAVSQDRNETSDVTIQTEYEIADIENRQYVQYMNVNEPAAPSVQYQLSCFASKNAYTYDMLATDITQTMQSYQGLVTYEVIGQSVKGKDIYALKVGHGQTQVLITAGVHARETANTPMIMQCLFDFLFAYTSDASQYANVLDRVTFVVVPLVNPDGYQYCIDKKNGRKKTNMNNVDINRNFPCKYWGSKIKKAGNYYPGPYPASEPETQTIMALFDQYSFTLAVDIHSRGRQIICMKGGYTPDDIVNQEDPEALNAISLSLAQNLLADIKYKLIKELKVKMGEEGTLTDYAFSCGVPTITFETCRYKANRLPKASEIQKEYQFFNWPGTLYKIADFAANLNENQ